VKTFTITNWPTIVAALSLTTITFTTNLAAAQLVRGAGDSFAEPLYKRYSKEYEQQTGEKFKYSVVGSGGGIRLFANKTVDFAGTSLIPTPIEQNQIEDGLLMVPTGGGAIAIVYNLKDVNTDVKLSRDTLAKIFTGQISNWQQVNPRFPNRKIQVVVNAESSGTSFTLTKYLRTITDGKIEASRKPNWGFRVYAAVNQDSAIAGEVQRVDGAIGYVQTTHPSSDSDEVINVEQLRDVSPGDWAYEALRSLVEKYRCITNSGNGTFEGNRVMNRYEFAHTLNNCLEKVGRKIYSLSNKFSTQEELKIIQRLQSEFATELKTLASKIDSLEKKSRFYRRSSV